MGEDKMHSAYFNLPLAGIAAEDPDLFALLIRTWRQSAGLTQQCLAERIGDSQRTISQIESGKRIPPRETVARLAAALDVPPVDTVMLHNLVGYDHEVAATEHEGPDPTSSSKLDAYLDSLVDDNAPILQHVRDEQHRIVRFNLLTAWTTSQTVGNPNDVLVDGMVSFPLLIVQRDGVMRFSHEPDQHLEIAYSRFARERLSHPESLGDTYERMKQIGDTRHLQDNEFASVPEHCDQQFTFEMAGRQLTIKWLEVTLRGHAYPHGSRTPEYILSTGTPVDKDSAATLRDFLEGCDRNSILPEFHYALSRGKRAA